jgi:hypothetical protein
MDIDVLVENFRETRKGREEEEEKEEEEEENDTVIEEEKCRVKTYQETANSLKVLQEFAVQRNDVESQAAEIVNCVQKTLLEFW